jgi:hypothetical protein
MQLTTAQPLWLALLCMGLGVGAAWLLYIRAGAELPPPVRRVLFVLRALSIALVAFFLLEPLVRSEERELRKPVLVLAHDGSASLVAAGDTAFLYGPYRTALEQVQRELGDRFEVRSFTYGAGVEEGLRFAQDRPRTDIGALLRAVHERFAGSELGAVVLDGDGIQNQGRDARLEATRLGVPVHTVLLGDTTVHPDLVLKGVEHNAITYLGNSTPVLVRVQADHLAGRRTVLELRQGERVVAEREVVITGDPFLQEVMLELKPDAAGPQRYVARLRPVDGERAAGNNSQSFVVDVLDDRQRIVLLAAAPHPDLGALRQALSQTEGYSIELHFAGQADPDLKGADLLVLHGLPSPRHPLAGLLDRAAALKIPALYIAALGTDLSALGRLQRAVGIAGGRPAVTDAQAAVQRDFPLFTLEDELVAALERFPPLQVPFAQYSTGRGGQALALQRIGMVRTNEPLLVFAQDEGRREGFIVGEGLWRWRMADHQLHGDHRRTDKLFHRMVQFLALKVNKEPFRVTHAAGYGSDEPVLFSAELYNANLEPVNTPEVQLSVSDSVGRVVNYAFDRTGNTYSLNAGRMAPGTYEWKAVTTFNGRALGRSGQFHVEEPQLERNNTVADHGLLRDLAALTQGEALPGTRISELVSLLEARPDLAARSYLRTRFSDLIGLRTLFFVVLTLLATEWVLRRRNGSY